MGLRRREAGGGPVGQPGIWASPSPGTAAPLPPARAGLPGSLARCQARRRTRAAGWGERRQRRGRGRAPWVHAAPQPGGQGPKGEGTPAGAEWAQGGHGAGSRWWGGPGGPAGGGRLHGAGTKQGSARPGCYLPAGLSPSLPPPSPWTSRGEAQGARQGPRQERRHGAVAVGGGRPSEAGPRAVKEKNIPRPANCCSQLFFFFFLTPPAWEGKKSSASSRGGCKKDAEF